MNPVALTFSIAVPVAFVAGVLFHRYVVSEASAIKAHVTAEVEEVRGDIASLLAKVAAKL